MKLLSQAYHRLRNEAGQDAAEYALLLGIIAMAVIGALYLFGLNLAVVWGLIVEAYIAAIS